MLPGEVLGGKGLNRSGSTWVLDSETLILKAFKDVQASGARLKSGEAQLHQIEANQDPKVLAESLRAQAAMLNPQIAALNQQLQQLGYARGASAMYRTTLNQQLSQIRNEQQRLSNMANNVNSQAPQFKEQMQKFNEEVDRLRRSHQEAVDSLRESVEKAMAKYAELTKDEPVVKAVADLSTASKLKQKLGPSKELLTVVKWLGGIAAVLQTETFDLRREGGVDRIDVQLGTGSAVSMALDTAAPQIVLPAALASKLGLKSSDRTVEWKAADGTMVMVPEMTIPTVRVGRMTARDVACAVVPAEKGDVAPVLGQSFLQQFDAKYLPDAGKLVLSKAESEQAAAKPRAGAAKAKPSGRSSKLPAKGKGAPE
jgi:hypothetical protein